MKVVATDSSVTAISVVIAVKLMCTSLSQHCHYHCCARFRCHAVLCTFSLLQCVLIFAATALCSSVSLSERCAHRCLTAVGFLLCIMNTTKKTLIYLLFIYIQFFFIYLLTVAKNIAPLKLTCKLLRHIINANLSTSG